MTAKTEKKTETTYAAPEHAAPEHAAPEHAAPEHTLLAAMLDAPEQAPIHPKLMLKLLKGCGTCVRTPAGWTPGQPVTLRYVAKGDKRRVSLMVKNTDAKKALDMVFAEYGIMPLTSFKGGIHTYYYYDADAFANGGTGLRGLSGSSLTKIKL